MTPKDGWARYEKLVLEKIKEHDEKIEKVDEILDKKIEKVYGLLSEINSKIAVLGVKSGVWGVIGGSVPAVIIIAYIILKTV